MATEAEVYIDRLDYLRNEIKKAIGGMSVEALNWTPLPEDTSSPCVLATHIAGSESFWIHQVVGGINVDRDRDSEFNARGNSVAKLEAMLEKAAQTTRNILQGLPSNALDQTREVRPEESPISLRWAILHMIEHMGQHLGHIALTKQLYAASRGQR